MTIMFELKNNNNNNITNFPIVTFMLAVTMLSIVTCVLNNSLEQLDALQCHPFICSK